MKIENFFFCKFQNLQKRWKHLDEFQNLWKGWKYYQGVQWPKWAPVVKQQITVKMSDAEWGEIQLYNYLLAVIW